MSDRERGPYSLTSEQRDEIVALYECGEKVDAIAAKYGVSREYPSKLSHRRGAARRTNRGRAVEVKRGID